MYAGEGGVYTSRDRIHVYMYAGEGVVINSILVYTSRDMYICIEFITCHKGIFKKKN